MLTTVVAWVALALSIIALILACMSALAASVWEGKMATLYTMIGIIFDRLGIDRKYGGVPK